MSEYQKEVLFDIVLIAEHEYDIRYKKESAIEPEKDYKKYDILEKKEKFDEKLSEQLSMHGSFGHFATILKSS